MESPRNSCRLCFNESEFNVPVFGCFGRRTNMKNKIAFLFKIEIDETEYMNTICYKCAAKVDMCYEFFMFVNKTQNKFAAPLRRPVIEAVNRRHVTSYVREQVVDADYSFSFLAMPDEKKEQKPPKPYFSYFSPPTETEFDHTWKTPKSVERPRGRDISSKRDLKAKTPRQCSRDLFASQTQDDEEPEPRAGSLDWKLTPDDDSIMKRIREKCFGRSDF